MNKRKQPSVPVNVANWSEASRRPLAYISAPSEYQDIHFKCYHCGRPVVFSPEAQREAFETRKAYIWQRRTLCQECFLSRVAIEHEVKELNKRWKSERRIVESQPDLLRRWLHLLEELPRYGARRNTAHIAMLRKLTQDAA